MRLLLQFPEGLKKKAFEMKNQYEKEGHDVFISVSPCYGACDLAFDEARHIKADKLIHFGHNRFVNTDSDIVVEYIPYHIDIDIKSLEKVLKDIKDYKNIALVTTIQHTHQFEGIRSFFEKNGKQVFAEPGEHAIERGQVLGCDTSGLRKIIDKVEAVVFIGDGIFHPLAIDFEKPVFVFNPYSKIVKNLSADIETLKKRKKGAIAKALTCKKFGIMLSTKIGQTNIKAAEWAKKELEKRGFECITLVANEMDPMAINNLMDIECLVNTACPRISDDQEKFGKPILNIGVLKELFLIIDANTV
ncbi:diphthamide biosynthesis enzyme Dph2 [Candidatus Micrarchaeota archaeon]|nr:diphthamide biosynthesis enzyme Dph2 [Candidatus Micrarchaeota archaeon]MBU1166600.1 diphthamide biosynthesis enzyme Dph2 [Candidatus Micrarchaeota archaeon]MBU1887268.1 diphthamide biosynthesis enzyme Dph2 [Candidatus Micrarchaeota archaeon]